MRSGRMRRICFGVSARAAFKTLLALLAAGAAPAIVFAQQPETIEYYGTDAIGSIRIVWDGNGTVIARQDFTPFGEAVLQQGTAIPKEGFGGNETDVETNQDYFHARMFEARTGRFTRTDPIEDGVGDPQRWNRYAYAGNNPVVAADPFGQSYHQEIPGGGSDNCDGDGSPCGTPPPASDDGEECASTQSLHPTGSVGGCAGGEQQSSTKTTTSTTATSTTTTTNTPCTGASCPPPGPTCHSVSTPSSGTWLAAAGDDAIMFLSWQLGVGPTDYNFGPFSAEAKEMAAAPGLLQKVQAYVAGTGPASDDMNFGASGYKAARFNPTAQFVGTYHFSFENTGSLVEATLTNTTTAWSFFADGFHLGSAILNPRPPTRTGWRPMGRVNQTFHLIFECS